MRFLRGMLWAVVIVGIIGLAMLMSGNFELADRLISSYLILQTYLPVGVTFEHFLLVATVSCVILMVIVIGVCTALLVGMGMRMAVAHRRHAADVDIVRRELDQVRGQGQLEYGQLIDLEKVLAKRLDKRVLVQSIVQAASRIASVGQANSAVSLWLLNFETDTLRFEMGIYCDETMFTKSIFELIEQPFAQSIRSHEVTTYAELDQQAGFIKLEKTSQLGDAKSMMIVPLVIENAVLGLLVLICHPDVLKNYEGRGEFYHTFWGELTLALAIAIQGELTILDRLTGAYNRDYFTKRLIQEIERADRFRLPTGVLMLDIDNFKAVNDMLGHPQGDAVLRIISKLIKKEVRAIDLVGRYGGEEFIIMLPETGFGGKGESAQHGILIVAQRICKAVEQEFSGMQKPLNLTVSIGAMVRRFPEDKGSDYRDMVRLADEQLYRAKTSGKNKVCALRPQEPEEDVESGAPSFS